MIEILVTHHAMLYQGLKMTLLVSCSAIVLGLPLGLALSLGLTSRYRVLRWPCGIYRSFWRGTPILLQLLLIFYLAPELGLSLEPVTAAVLALALNTAAFQGEIFRSGLAHVPPGQVEAARMLGMRRWVIDWRIRLPQAIRVSLPPLTNEVITILKNSSLVSVIAVTELMRVSDQIVSRTFKPLETYLAAALLYLCVNLVLASIGAWLERRQRIGVVSRSGRHADA